ncbi:MAG TPA: hypothetical protein VJH33_01280 [Candidatus Paceibacterota bacterium]
MTSFHERNNPLYLLGKRLLLLCIFGAILLMIPGVWKVYMQERESRTLRNEAVGALSDLEAREKRVREQIDTLNTSRGLETALREQFSLAKEGENLIIVVGRPSSEILSEKTKGLLGWFGNLVGW